MLQLKDLKVGDRIVMPYYDQKPCTVDMVDVDDDYQPIHVVWEDGSDTWPEQQHVCENTVRF